MRGKIKIGATIMAVLIAVVMALVFAGTSAQAAEYWKQKQVRFSATAGETLAAGDVVCIKAADGKAYKADANDADLRPAVGVIDKGGLSTATVEIVTIGVLAGQTAASPGKRLFLSETAGAMTVTAPTNAQALGWVLPGTAGTSTTYFISVNTPTSGGAGY